MSKTSLMQELAALVAGELATHERAHRSAREAASHDEAKPENDKDTRALEQSYLARGEALRVAQLRAALVDVRAMPLRAFGRNDAAALGALVTVSEDGASTTMWLAPHGGGKRLAGGAILVVTPKSPLGRALLGRRIGDECAVVLTGKMRLLVVASLS